MTLRESTGAVEQESAQAENGICVVGTPRGGNSLVAGALQRLGVYLGEEEELPAPDGATPLGSFELPRISELNDALVEHLGLGSLDAPVPPRGWERDAQLKPLGERARSALDEAFGEARIWAWKDARNAVTLPFWQRLLSGTRYVICIRNPLDAAQSLRAVDDGQELEPYMSVLAAHGRAGADQHVGPAADRDRLRRLRLDPGQDRAATGPVRGARRSTQRRRHRSGRWEGSSTHRWRCFGRRRRSRSTEN